MSIIWSQSAIEDVDDILIYISKDNPTAAKKLVDKILGSVNELLLLNPLIGRVGRVTNSRELVIHASYLVTYEVHGGEIEILSVRHTSRLWPESF